MKVFKFSVAIQLMYCLGCVIVMICMPLFRAFYPTNFSKICLSIGVFFTVAATFNPLGVLCSVLNIILYFTTELNKSKKVLTWIILAPFLIIICWILAVCFHVYFTGGV